MTIPFQGKIHQDFTMSLAHDTMRYHEIPWHTWRLGRLNASRLDVYELPQRRVQGKSMYSMTWSKMEFTEAQLMKNRW
jgi:hypothetical protein